MSKLIKQNVILQAHTFAYLTTNSSEVNQKANKLLTTNARTPIKKKQITKGDFHVFKYIFFIPIEPTSVLYLFFYLPPCLFANIIRFYNLFYFILFSPLC